MMMTWSSHPIWPVAVFLMGACVGSLLNVCVYRLPRGLSTIFPDSYCFHCGLPVRWRDNIPVLGWFLLRGRCRDCGVRFSIRYALVELFTALLFLGVWQLTGFSLLSLIYAVMIFGLLMATFIDLDHFIIPDRVSWGGIVLGLCCSVLVPELHGFSSAYHGLLASLGGAATGFGVLWIVAILGKAVFKRDAMGFGDVKLLGAIGAFLGWQGALFSLVASAFLGSIVGGGIMLVQGKAFRAEIPYGPYLAGAAILYLFQGEALIRWYIGLFGGG